MSRSVSREVRRALRAVEALSEPSFEDLAAVGRLLADIQPGTRAEVYGLLVERAEDRAAYRVVSPWCGRRLSAVFGPSGPVARRLLREKLARSWSDD